MRYALIGLLLGSVLASAGIPASAQTVSPDSLFPGETAHDFGTVARGSKLRYTFWLVNTSGMEARILGWKPKCGCTDVKVGAREVPTGTQTPIEATLDTTRFQNRKDSGLTLQVQVGQTYFEKDLNIGCFIRGDVMLDPGFVEFGTLIHGATPSMNLTLNYLGGNPGWRINNATTISDKVSAGISSPVQLQGGGLQYQITVTLSKDAPIGYLKDEINLLTTDPSNPSIPISVVANVQGAVTVTPGNLVMGRVQAGQTITKTVLVKSSKPFKITGTSSPKTDNLTASSPTATEGPLQQLVVTLKAPTQPGPFNAVLDIQTNIKDEPPAKLTAFATVVP